MLGNGIISNCAGQTDRRNATRVGVPRICASPSKDLNHFAATPTAEGRTPERRVSMFVDWVYLGASFQESTHNAGRVFLRSEVQRSPPASIGSVRLGASVKKPAYLLLVAVDRGLVEGSSMEIRLWHAGIGQPPNGSRLSCGLRAPQAR